MNIMPTLSNSVRHWKNQWYPILVDAWERNPFQFIGTALASWHSRNLQSRIAFSKVWEDPDEFLNQFIVIGAPRMAPGSACVGWRCWWSSVWELWPGPTAHIGNCWESLGNGTTDKTLRKNTTIRRYVLKSQKNPKVAQNAGKILSNVMHCWIMLPFSQITFMSIPD